MTNFSLSAAPATGWDITSWALVRAYMQEALSSTSKVLANTWTDGENKPSGTIPIARMHNMRNGLVFVTPRDSAVVATWNPATNLYSAGAVHGLGTTAFQTSVYSPATRKVLMVPDAALSFALYDEASGAVTVLPAHGLGGTSPYCGGAGRGLDGKAYIAPGVGKTAILSYDFATGDLAVAGSLPVAAAAQYSVMQLLPNGDFWLHASGSTSTVPSYAFRPSTGVVTATGVPAAAVTASYWQNGRSVLLPNGTVLGSPSANAWQGYNARDNLMQQLWATKPADNISVMAGGELMPDGRVYVAGRNYAGNIAWDPVGKEVTVLAVPTSAATTGKWRTTLTLPDGRVLHAPHLAAKWGIYTGYSVGFPPQVIQSPWYQ